MEINYLRIPGLVEFIPRIIRDYRGIFFESYRKEILLKAGIDREFVQDNQSVSKKNVIRGIHLQLIPHAQGKLVRVVKGKGLDVAVDLRMGSGTFGEYEGIILDSERNNMLYIPEGFGHGFLAMEDTILTYKCTAYYQPSADTGIRWDDPDLNIDWGIDDPIVSDKDKNLPSFKSFKQINT